MTSGNWVNWLRSPQKGSRRNAAKRKAPSRFVPNCEPLEQRVLLDDNSAGPRGIDARGLGFTGQGVYIGQVESGRPGLRGTADLPFDSNANSHPDVRPDAVFRRNLPA